MFTPVQIEDLKAHLNEIKADLLLHKKETAQEAWWPTPYYINADEYAFEESYDIFNGNCGIALFFLALYGYDHDEAHLKLIDKMMYRISSSEAILKPRFFALYTGMGGLIYTYLKIFEVTDNQKYLDSALSLVLTHQKQLSEELLKADLLSGYTGNLLLFTLLYHHTQNNEIFALINLLLERLITEARVSEQGLKWDYGPSKKAYDSMAGFSHGASGIAYVLMQLNVYFEAPGLLYLAEEALAYEMQYYHAPAKNWLDLRIAQLHLSKPNAHLWKLDTFILGMVSVNAWAHGAAGVGLSRSFVFDLTQKEIYLKQCDDALDKCLTDLASLQRPDFTLVSGYSGMVPLLLWYNDWQNEAYTNQVMEVFNEARKQYHNTNSYNGYISCSQSDYGLFSGKSGVGYLILQVLLGKSSDFIIKPALPRNHIATPLKETFTSHYVQKKIFSRYFKRTIEKMEMLNENFDFGSHFENIEAYITWLDEEIKALKEDQTEIVALFNLEREILRLWKQHKGYYSYQQRNQYINEKAAEISLKTDAELTELDLKVNDRVKYYAKNGSDSALILVCEENGIKEINAGVFAAVIFETLANRKLKVALLMAEIIAGYFETRSNQEKISQKIIQQIRLLIKVGFLSCN